MRYPRRTAKLAPLCLLAPLLVLAGCGKKIWVTQYPEFYSPDLKRIVVAPFHNATDHPQAGPIITDKVTAAMVANGTYDLYTPADLRELLGRDAPPTADSAAELAAMLRKSDKVQAILTGTVTAFSVQTDRDWRQAPVYARDKKGRIDEDTIVGYRDYTFVRHEAVVDATAKLIHVGEAKVLHATAPGLARTDVISQTNEKDGTPPAMGRNECLASATDQAVAKLMEEFALVRKQVRVSKNALRTAAGPDDGKWDYEGTFRASDERLYVVLRLPPQCDRNRFRITIVAKASDTKVSDFELVWQREWSDEQGKGFAFSPAELIAAGGGPGDYRAILHCCDDEPVLEAKFKIQPAE